MIGNVTLAVGSKRQTVISCSKLTNCHVVIHPTCLLLIMSPYIEVIGFMASKNDVDEFTLELLESPLRLIQMVKGTLCVGIRCWEAWQSVGIWRPGNENRLRYHVLLLATKTPEDPLRPFHGKATKVRGSNSPWNVQMQTSCCQGFAVSPFYPHGMHVFIMKMQR